MKHRQKSARNPLDYVVFNGFATLNVHFTYEYSGLEAKFKSADIDEFRQLFKLIDKLYYYENPENQAIKLEKDEIVFRIPQYKEIDLPLLKLPNDQPHSFPLTATEPEYSPEHSPYPLIEIYNLRK